MKFFPSLSFSLSFFDFFFLMRSKAKKKSEFSFLIALKKGNGSKLETIKEECGNIHVYGTHCYYISTLDILSVYYGKIG